MNRQDYNRLILDKLHLVVEEKPDLRFGQILWNLGILEWKEETSCKAEPIVRDIFYDESKNIYERCVRQF